MNKKLKTNLTLSVIALFLGVLSYFALKSSPVQRRQRFFSFNENDLSSFSITKYSYFDETKNRVINDSLYISKVNNEWKILFPLNRKVADDKMVNFLNKVINVDRFDKILTRNPLNFEYYGVDDFRGTRVIFYNQNGGILDDVFFGMADILAYGAARKSAESTVYELSANVVPEISTNMSFWRDNHYLKFSSEETDSVFVRYSRSEYYLINENNRWFYQDKNERFFVNNAHKAFHRAMMQLNNFKTYYFVDDQWDEYKDNFQNPILYIKIFKKDNTYDELLFARYDDRNTIVKVNGDTETLYLGSYDMTNRFTRSSESFKDILHQTW